MEEQRWPVAALLIGTYARLKTASTATEWAFDRWLVDGCCVANPRPASMMIRDSPAGFCRAAKKYLLLPGLYQISSPPPSLTSDASTVPSRSSMIAVLAAVGLTLQPSPIWWSGPIARPCGPVQLALGMTMVRKTARVVGSNTTTPPGEELSPAPLISGMLR